MTKRWEERLRVAIVGAGYISDFHALALRKLREVDLIGVCDTDAVAAASFAARWGVTGVFSSLEAMLRSHRVEVVHILTPPDRHFESAMTALQFGANVLVEKPICVSVAQADQLIALATTLGLRVGVVHNMLFSNAYLRLREAIRSGDLGPVSQLQINHFAELAPIRVGPFHSWMLESPQNVLFEIGPHPLSIVLDLLGLPGEIFVTAGRDISIPGGNTVFRRWHVSTAVGAAAVQIDIDLGPGFSQRGITARGLIGSVTADLDADTCTLDVNGTMSVDLERFRRSRSIARQLRTQASATLREYISSKLNLGGGGNPYQLTIRRAIASFYGALKCGKPLDKRVDATSGRDVIDCCERIIRASGVRSNRMGPPNMPISRLPFAPTVLVFGGTGFIGRELVKQLVAEGRTVRVAVRRPTPVFEDIDNTNLEIVKVDVNSPAELEAAMRGVRFVYHLARAEARSGEDSIAVDVGLTTAISSACLSAGVERFVYTATIDSYYAGARGAVITEVTPLDPKIARRNYYARAKAAAELLLVGMYEKHRLPVVIFRPGIVIGPGGNPFHWGIGSWVSPGVCLVWGDGRNPLPFVLVSDVASALLRGITTQGIEGRSYNLVDLPLLSARDYLTEIQRRSGMRIRVFYRPIWTFFLTDVAKWIVKLAIHHPDRSRIPSYRDWKSRTQNATFSSDRARTELKWEPASNKQRMIDEGVGGSLFSWLAALR